MPRYFRGPRSSTRNSTFRENAASVALAEPMSTCAFWARPQGSTTNILAWSWPSRPRALGASPAGCRLVDTRHGVDDSGIEAL